MPDRIAHFPNGTEVFCTTLPALGKMATGIELPAAVVDAVSASKQPKPGATIKREPHRTSVMGAGYPGCP